MDEELMDIITEQNIEVKPVEVIENEVAVEDEEYNVSVEEAVGTIEAETPEELIIEMDESIGWVGGDSERHYSLLGRDDPNQHTIKAITGLREELDDIEKLQTVFSDKYNHANYYKWHEAIPDSASGLFVSFHPSTNHIKVCDVTDEIFGVTVESAAFVGGQDNVVRGAEYGLVVCSGVVSVKCELDVRAGDNVVSNGYGCAQKAKSGYGHKVIGIKNINGVLYAVISLGISVNQVNDLMIEFDVFGTRLGKVETDMVAAINVAQQAYNKSNEADSVSQEAIKEALDAILKAEGAIDKNKELEGVVASTNQIAVQTQAIANNAVSEAQLIRDTAEKTANEALTNVNELIKDLEPITTWEYTDETGEVHKGAEYLTTYINNDVATKAEVYTVETLAEDNKSSIEKSAESFRTLVSSVDKYSVGEYSQTYGLSREQAKSILKIGMIYVPTKHIDDDSHSEIFTDESEEQWFTPGSYYEWDGDDWIEYGNSVSFGMNIPAYTSQLKYWYINSNTAPIGYEPYTLYIWKDEKWTKVNIYYNNPNNRIASSISQDVDSISLEVTNARGSMASLSERIDADEATIQGVVSWSTDNDGEQYNLATIQQKADDAGASITQIVKSIGENGEVSAASIVAAINGTSGDSIVKIDAKHVEIEGSDITLKGKTINISADDVLGIESAYFSVDQDGKVTAVKGEIGGWTMDDNVIYIERHYRISGMYGGVSSNDTDVVDYPMMFSEGSDFDNGDIATIDETDGYYTYSLSNDEATITGVDTSISGTITIPSFLGGYPVTSIEGYAFSGCENLRSVTISKYITSIGDCAFYDCTGLTSIVVNTNNEKYTSIDGNLYSKDKKTLIQYAIGKTNTSFTIPDDVITIGQSAFYYCTSLTSVTIGDSVTEIKLFAFRDCTSLTSVTINSPTTSIFDNPYTISSTAKIYGHSNSTAESYAVKHSRSFESVCEYSQEVVDDKYLKSGATCIAKAEYYKSCSCGAASKNDTFTVGDYGDHVWDNGIIITSPTNTTDGKITYTCTVCGETKEEVIPAYGEHDCNSNSWEYYDENQHKGICTICYKTIYANHNYNTLVRSDTGHWYKCEYCTATTTPENHTWDEGVITTPPTHTEEGIKTYTCTVCGQTKTESVAKLTDHTYGSWIKHDKTQHKRICECGAVEYESHVWNEGVVNDKTITYTCVVCNETKEEEIKSAACFFAGYKPTETAPYVPENPGDAPFMVLANGDLYASSAEITGKIIATSGEIGKCSIDEEGNLKITSANIDGPLMVGQLPEINMSDLTNDMGYITGEGVTTIIDGVVTTDYVNGLGCDFDQGSVGGWKIDTDKIYKGNVGLYTGSNNKVNSLVTDSTSSVRFYAGNTTPTEAAFRVLDDGSLYASSANISGGFTSKDKGNILTINNGALWSNQNTTYNSYTTIYTAAGCAFSAGYNEDGCDQYDFNNTDGFTIAMSSYADTAGVRIGVIAAQCKNLQGEKPAYQNVRIQFEEKNNYLMGNWLIQNGNGGVAVSSDINCKNSISNIPDIYRTVFANLKPKIYKYNDGTSNRYHVGFIAQDVEEAIFTAGLTTQDFAGLVIVDRINEKTGKSETVYMLRYEEFIALNTLEIQRLQSYVGDLEARIAKLETLIEKDSTA